MKVPTWAWIAGGVVAFVALSGEKKPKVPIIQAEPGPAPVGASPSTIMLYYWALGTAKVPKGYYWRLAGGEPTRFPVGWHGPYATKDQAVSAAQAAAG